MLGSVEPAGAPGALVPCKNPSAMVELLTLGPLKRETKSKVAIEPDVPPTQPAAADAVSTDTGHVILVATLVPAYELLYV